MKLSEKLLLGVTLALSGFSLLFSLAVYRHLPISTTKSVGAFIASPSTFTDLESTNDTQVDGALRVAGASTFTGAVSFAGGFTNSGTTTPTGLAGVATQTGSTLTTTVCSILNSSGSTRVISKANSSIDVNAVVAGAVTTTLTYGVTSTAQGISYGSSLIHLVTPTTSTVEQILSTTTVGMVSWPTGSYLVLSSSASTTQTYNCRALNYGF